MGLQYGVPPEVYVSKLSHHALRAERHDERRRHPRREVDPRLHLPLVRQEVPDARAAGGDRDPLARGEGDARRALRERRRHRRRPIRSRRRRPARRRSSTRGRTPSSAPAAAAAWCARAPATRAATAARTPAARSGPKTHGFAERPRRHRGLSVSHRSRTARHHPRAAAATDSRSAFSPWSPGTTATVRAGAAGGIPNGSRSPWTTSTGTSTASSSGKRLGAGAPVRRGGRSGNARQSTPVASTSPAVRQATRAPDERPPAISSCSLPSSTRSHWTTSTQAASSCRAGAGERRPATRYGLLDEHDGEPVCARRVAHRDEVRRRDPSPAPWPRTSTAAGLAARCMCTRACPWLVSTSAVLRAAILQARFERARRGRERTVAESPEAPSTRAPVLRVSGGFARPSHLHSLKGWGSALLATVLWPLLLLGVNLHIH